MLIYFTVGAQGHLNGWSSNPMNVEDEYQLEVAEDHEVLINPDVFKLEGGALIKDEAYQQRLLNASAAQSAKPNKEELNAIALMELTKMIMNRGV